jgi:hypothetical protein
VGPDLESIAPDPQASHSFFIFWLIVGYVYWACSGNLPIADGAWVICMTALVIYVIRHIQQVWSQPFKQNKPYSRQGVCCSRFYSQSCRGNRVMIKVMSPDFWVKIRRRPPVVRPKHTCDDDKKYQELRVCCRASGWYSKECPCKTINDMRFGQYLALHGQTPAVQVDWGVSLDILSAFLQVPMDWCEPVSSKDSTDLSVKQVDCCFSASLDAVDSPI